MIFDVWIVGSYISSAYMARDKGWPDLLNELEVDDDR